MFRTIIAYARRVAKLPGSVLADIVADLTPDKHGECSGFTFNAPGKNSQKDALGPNQLAWLDKHFAPFNGFAVMRAQAEAAKGVPSAPRPEERR